MASATAIKVQVSPESPLDVKAFADDKDEYPAIRHGLHHAGWAAFGQGRCP